ncbi:hypothetical protein [Parasphingorhabdus sp.]|uniref:hypothetical protein n=1 Tax=Parasphingorhabdus sp. TaxID=2709688 RepID=UPI003267C37C
MINNPKPSTTLAKSILGCAMILSLSSPALATKDTKEKNPDANEIVVVGQQTRTEVIQELIVNQFKVSAGGRNTGQYARFAAPICPSVGGLSNEDADKIENRIRDIAELGGLLVAADNCSPNLIVVAVENGAHEIESLRKKQHRVFNTMTHRERDKLIEDGGPVFSWKATQQMASDSIHAARTGTIDMKSEGTGPITARGQRSHVKSLIKKPEFAGIVYSYLLIENKALSGVSLNQLADYAAIVSLIDINVKFETTPPPPGSILSLFTEIQTDQPPPQSISEGDLLMVRGLYKAAPNVKAPLQRSAMLHTINEALERPAPEE